MSAVISALRALRWRMLWGGSLALAVALSIVSVAAAQQSTLGRDPERTPDALRHAPPEPAPPREMTLGLAIGGLVLAATFDLPALLLYMFDATSTTGGFGGLILAATLLGPAGIAGTFAAICALADITRRHLPAIRPGPDEGLVTGGIVVLAMGGLLLAAGALVPAVRCVATVWPDCTADRDWAAVGSAGLGVSAVLAGIAMFANGSRAAALQSLSVGPGPGQFGVSVHVMW